MKVNNWFLNLTFLVEVALKSKQFNDFSSISCGHLLKLLKQYVKFIKQVIKLIN